MLFLARCLVLAHSPFPAASLFAEPSAHFVLESPAAAAPASAAASDDVTDELFRDTAWLAPLLRNR